jgi:hypothetical protein
MKQIYSNLTSPFLCLLDNLGNKSSGFLGFVLLGLVLSFAAEGRAQNTYTLGTGTEATSALGVSPFATINRNTRSQYLYYAQELYDLDAISGNIVSIAVNIKSLALPANLKPENLTIKMGMTDDVALGTSMIEGLPEYYFSATENINALGWYTFTLQTPFEWDGVRNIIVEICRSNAEFGTSFEVETTMYNPLDYRTVGLYTNDTAIAGCSLTGTSEMTNANRRTRPNMQFTMTQPCDGVPVAGTTAVTAGPYCSGESFTLSVTNGATESGLFYQWQSAPNENGPWTDVAGANNATYTTTQSIATYYRRTTTCLESQQTINDLGILVGGEGCYCTALVTNENSIGITNVAFNGIDNSTSGNDSYSNYTSIQTEVERTVTYDLSVRINTNGGTNYTMAWIDWNQNGSYEVAEGYTVGNVTGGTDVSSGTVSIAVPADAVLGSTTMRVRTAQSALNESPTACGPIENGEAEDYTVVVLNEPLSVSNPDSANSDLLVYPSENALHVTLRNAEIASVNVFDLSGRRLVSKGDIDASSAVFENFTTSNQVLIVKVTTTSGAVLLRKIIF